MDNRNSSSSPDPLEYPGDPKFLLSSATKSIPRRVSYSPRKSQTPQRHSQLSHHNASIKPLKFSDVVLPSTPQRGRNSVSPSKTTLQSEGNVSPWRIRVTVEAEPEEDENGGAAGGQNGMPGFKDATTTKVPLKGGLSSTEPTPKKRKTPRRKSVSERVPTPRRRKSSASPEKGSAGTTPKRGRGRPRKSLQAIDANGDQPRPSPSIPTQDMMDYTQNKDPFLDIAMDNSPANESPANGAGFPVVDSAMPDQASVNGNLSEPLTPNEPEHDQASHLTPERSPQPQDGSSPGNTLHAGHTPRAKFPRYPTPRSSSLLEGDGANGERHSSIRSSRELSDTKRRRLNDPTAMHREFDSIMESEGFSMVSLNTLPSAKQQLNSASKAGVEAASSLLSRSQASHASSKSREPPTTVTTSPPRARESGLGHSQSAAGDVAYPTLDIADQKSISEDQQQETQTTSPQPRSPGLSDLRRRKPLRRLVRVIRAGIALRGALKRQHQVPTLQFPYFGSNNNPDEDVEAARQRLNELFYEFDPETQRELSAGLRFGEEMAIMREQNEEWRPEHETGSREERGDDESVLSSEIGPPPRITSPSTHSQEERSPTPRNNPTRTLEEKMVAEMERRQQEWQREREAISRQIEAANSSQVIVINDEQGDETPSASDADVEGTPKPQHQNIWQQWVDGEQGHEQEQEYDEEPREEDYAQGKEEEEEEEDEDEEEEEKKQEGEEEGEEVFGSDGFQDIWQQEAQQFAAPPLEETGPPRPPRLPRWEIREYVEPENAEPQRVPDWRAPNSDRSILDAGKTQMAKYRDGDFEFSSLLGTPESATRRFYQDDIESPPDMNPPRDNLQSAQPQRLADPNARRVESSPQVVKTAPSKEPPPEPLLPPEQLPLGSYSADEDSRLRMDEEYMHIVDDQSVSDHHDTQPSRRAKLSRSPDESSSSDRQSDRTDYEFTHPNPVAPVEPPAPPVPNVTRDNRGPPHAASPTRNHEKQELSVSSSWFNTLTELVPSWLTSKVSRGFDSGTTHEATTAHRHPPAQRKHDNRNPTQSANHATQTSAPLQPASNRRTPLHKKTRHGKPLSLGGYFTDDHFDALHALYCEAKRHPERFPYESTPERDALVGQWLYSLGGLFPRKITEIQIAIMVRFRKDLVEASRRRGGSDQLEWSELYILWRLWSIIVGEKLRRERKLAHRAQMS